MPSPTVYTPTQERRSETNYVARVSSFPRSQQFVRTLFNDMAQKMNVRVKAAINHALFNGQAS